jgi:hypothetical protein
VPGSPLVRRLLTIGALAVAVGLLVLGALYQQDTSPAVDVASPTGVPADRATPNDDAAAAINPVQGFLPRSGQGSTCTEPVGVALVDGYAASLTINGVPIDATMMNPIDSAGGSLNRYTYGPEPGCPNGPLLRPRANLVEACVWRIGQSPETCRTYAFEFDAL